MKQCPKHKMIRVSDENFCIECGEELEQSNTCLCGYSLLNHYQYCPKCGLKITKS